MRPKIKNYSLKSRRKKKYKMNIDPNEYQIGDWVNVSATSSSVYKKGKKVIKTEAEPIPLWGRVVGIKKFFIGNYQGHRQTLNNNSIWWSEPDVEYEAPYLDITESVYLWEVKIGLLNKPIYALPNNMTKAFGIIDGDIPVFYSERTEMSEERKRMLREEMKDVPRDKKGRWKSVKE